MLIETRTSDAPTPPLVRWQDIRCHKCSRLLARASGCGVLRVGENLQLKCGSCNAVLKLTGSRSGLDTR